MSGNSENSTSGKQGKKNLGGWVKLHRSLLSSAVYKDAKALQVWIYLLLAASHQEHQQIIRGELSTLQRGELGTSEHRIAEMLNLDRSTVHRKLNMLQEMGQICIKRNHRKTVISLVNYASYQGSSTTDTTTEPTTEPTTDPTHTRRVKKNIQEGIKKPQLTLLPAVDSDSPSPYPDSQSPVKLKKVDIEALSRQMGVDEFHYWVQKLREYAETKPAKFAAYKNHRRVIETWREISLGKGLMFFRHPQSGAALYKTWDVERWRSAN